MCTVCGCGEGETHIEGEEAGNDHPHAHTHGELQGPVHTHAEGTLESHPRGHSHGEGVDLDFGAGPAYAHAAGMSQERMVRVERDILAKNDAYAAANRRRLADLGVFALNLVSSPGSGKTSLLVRTIEALKGRVPIAVVEGDQQTSADADRIRATGVPAVQINTGKGCHLDAHMVGHALERLPLAEGSLLLIENVGNLVCPAPFDLGEAHKAVILSVTEGDDKPLKYPDMFYAAGVMVLNKMDLLPHVDFDTDLCIEYAHRVNPSLRVIRVSARSGEGMDTWLDWLLAGLEQAAEADVDSLRRRIAELESRLAAIAPVGEGS
jgi:hydrogenase nickel incorporation protein HypB